MSISGEPALEKLPQAKTESFVSPNLSMLNDGSNQKPNAEDAPKRHNQVGRGGGAETFALIYLTALDHPLPKTNC
jgi:hypothetical protein